MYLCWGIVLSSVLYDSRTHVSGIFCSLFCCTRILTYIKYYTNTNTIINIYTSFVWRLLWPFMCSRVSIYLYCIFWWVRATQVSMEIYILWERVLYRFVCLCLNVGDFGIQTFWRRMFTWNAMDVWKRQHCSYMYRVR